MPDQESKINYLVNYVPVVLCQILSSNFHIRTFVEAILVKLYTEITSNPNGGSSALGLTENAQIKVLIGQIYSIVRPVVDELDFLFYLVL